ncbi:MAG: putative DNA binding domain-containing protein [Clostridium sp.]
MNINKLNTLLRKEENTKLDFKLSLDLSVESGKREFAKDVSAIANVRGGRGYLVIGVMDKTKEIIGIDFNDFNEEKIQQIVSSRINPPIPISLDFVNVESKIVAVITIYDGKQRPYQIRENGCFLTRRGSTTDFMRREEIANYLNDSFNLNVELSPVIRSSVAHIDKELVKDYVSKNGIEYNDEDFNDLMENIGIITREKESGNYVATMGGLLVFSKINSIYIPHNMIRINNEINKEYKEVIIVQGNLKAMIDDSTMIVSKILGDNQSVANVIKEAIKNAVLYRDYTIFNKEIEVTISNKEIRVVSPGTMIMDKSKNSISVRRNMWIYEKIMVMYKSKYEKKYSGFETMKKNLKPKGRIRLINDISENCFKVIFPMRNKNLER